MEGGKRKAERGKETDTAMITAKIHSNNFITNLHLFCFFLSVSFSGQHFFLTRGLLPDYGRMQLQVRERERSYRASGTANRIGAVWFWQYVEPTIMKEIDTETTVVWPAWCYSGKWDTPSPTLPYIHILVLERLLRPRALFQSFPCLKRHLSHLLNNNTMNRARPRPDPLTGALLPTVPTSSHL